MSKLDSKANMNKVAKATKLAHKALERYGEPYTDDVGAA